MAARPRSTVFARIRRVVGLIPRGRVATYGQVAILAGLPRHARHVGYALHALPEATPLPWHRVLGAGGALRLRAWGAADTQRLRLEREGVRFGPRGRVPLERFGWRPDAAMHRRLLREARGDGTRPMASARRRRRAPASAPSRDAAAARLDPRRSLG